MDGTFRSADKWWKMMGCPATGKRGSNQQKLRGCNFTFGTSRDNGRNLVPRLGPPTMRIALASIELLARCCKLAKRGRPNYTSVRRTARCPESRSSKIPIPDSQLRRHVGRKKGTIAQPRVDQRMSAFTSETKMVGHFYPSMATQVRNFQYGKPGNLDTTTKL